MVPSEVLTGHPVRLEPTHEDTPPRPVWGSGQGRRRVEVKVSRRSHRKRVLLVKIFILSSFVCRVGKGGPENASGGQ